MITKMGNTITRKVVRREATSCGKRAHTKGREEDVAAASFFHLLLFLELCACNLNNT